MPLTPSDLNAEGGAVWLLEIDWEGVPYRFCDALPDGEALVITDADGVDLEYRGGLLIEWRSDFGLLAESAAPPVVSVNIPFSAGDNIPQKVANGADLSMMEATLYRWTPTMTHAKRVPVFAGQAQQPNYGPAGEPVAVTFESPIYRDGITFPAGRIEAAQLEVDSALATGDPYPVVFGNPAYTDGTNSLAAGAPAIPYDNTNRYLLLGYLIGGASPSTLWNVGSDASKAFTQATITDKKGRRVTRVAHTDAISWDADEEYAMEYSRSATTDMAAGDLLLYCAEASSLRVDENEFRARAQALNEYKFSGYIDAEVPPWEWALRNILPLVPASAYYGANGLSLRVWDDLATANDAMLTLDTSTDPIVRVGPVQYESAPILNEVVVRYKPDQTGDYRASRTVTGRPALATSAEVSLSPYAAASVSRLRGRDAASEEAGVRRKVVESPFIYDDATAGRIAAWMVRAFATPRRVVTYRDTSGKLEWLEETEHVTITDTEIALTNQLAMVRSRRWSNGVFYVDLALIDDVLR